MREAGRQHHRQSLIERFAPDEPANLVPLAYLMPDVTNFGIYGGGKVEAMFNKMVSTAVAGLGA